MRASKTAKKCSVSLKTINFDVEVRKRRTENWNLCGINEDLSTKLTLLTRKKAIYRGGLYN